MSDTEIWNGRRHLWTRNILLSIVQVVLKAMGFGGTKSHEIPPRASIQRKNSKMKRTASRRSQQREGKEEEELVYQMSN